MTTNSQKTVDPLSSEPSGEQRTPAEVVLEVLFHSDLHRIGERYVLGPAAEARAATPVLLGRDIPRFRGLEGGTERGLLDPCISRHQATIRWLPEQRVFRVEAPKDARRPLRLLSPEGQLLESFTAGPGALLAIGDRLLLLLGVRPGEPSADPLGMIGQSAAMAALRQRVRAVASFDDAVLIQGETGTGKELIAQAIHQESRRRGGPFIALNCAALPEHLIESELFGHVKGAFSGASQSKSGLFAAAAGGTLFLDEIGDMPLPVQAKLLRALEVKSIRPVGAQHEERVDVRIVAATHRDLVEHVAQGKFREDLFARIESPQISVPPLRERRSDVPALFVAFLGRRAQDYARQQGKPREQTPFAPLWREPSQQPPAIPLDFFLGMIAHDWPRNVRGVDKFAAEVATAMVLCNGLPSLPGRAPPAASQGTDAQQRQRPERAELARILEEQRFNQTDTARLLGVSYATIDRWMRELNIARPRDLSPQEVASAREQAGGDLSEAARLLRVSLRGLKSRMKELGLD